MNIFVPLPINRRSLSFYSESGRGHIACFGQRGIGKCDISRGLNSSCKFSLVLSCCWKALGQHKNKPKLAYWKKETSHSGHSNNPNRLSSHVNKAIWEFLAPDKMTVDSRDEPSCSRPIELPIDPQNCEQINSCFKSLYLSVVTW